MGKFIFDGPTLSILGDASAVVNGVFSFSAVELYSAWVDWAAQGDNLKYPPAFRTVGGDPIGGGQYIGAYVFMRNDLGWRGHPPNTGDVQVVIDGNFYPEDSGMPFFDPWQGATTSLISRVSSMTQAILTSGTPAPTAAEVAAAVWSDTTGAAVAIRLAEAWGRLGLDPSKPLVTGTSQISFGDIAMALAESAGSVTLTRQ